MLEGELQAKGLKFAIVVSRFNDFITSKLLDGAKDALLRHGAKEDDIDIARVPETIRDSFDCEETGVKRHI